VHPGKAKLISESRLKNDRVDSRALAELLRNDFLPTAYLAPRQTRDLREFLRGRIFLVRLRTTMKNSIHAILWKHGLQSPRADLFGKRGRAWLAEQTLRPVYAEEAKALLRTIDQVSAEISMLDREVRRYVHHDAQARLIMTMPGVGAFSALVIQAEVGDFSRFPTAEKLACYAGLISSSRSSGGTVRLGRITKHGSSHLRTVMVESACRVTERWGTLYAFYARIRERKGCKTADSG
jgi:transposase